MTGPEVAPPLLGARVLVVDDELPIRSALVRSLTLLGYDADEASSGYEALEMLGRHHYDVMVVDLRMPGMDGTEVMQQAHRIYPKLPIIVLTGYGTLESAMIAIRSGAVDYLLKPAKICDLATVVAKALQERLAASGEPPVESILRVGPITLDRQKRLVIVATGGTDSLLRAELTPSEVTLLAYLMQRPGVVVSCQELCQALGYTVSAEEAQTIVRPHISRLRRKVEPQPLRLQLIRTVLARGYVFSP